MRDTESRALSGLTGRGDEVKERLAAVDNALMLAMTWVAFGLGLLALTTGVVSLARQQLFPCLRHRARWQPWAWSTIMFGLFLVTETVPRLADATAGWTFALSLAAFAPLVAFVDFSIRDRLKRR